MLVVFAVLPFLSMMLGFILAFFVIWYTFSSPSVTAHEDIFYNHRLRNSSIDISCISGIKDKEDKPFGFTLKRRLLQSRRVLYLSRGLSPSINRPDEKKRIFVRDELENHTVHLTISNLQGQDTDVYHCQFHYGDLLYDRTVPGRTQFFIYVEDLSQEPCHCWSCLALLYVISGAVCLLGILVIAIATAYHCKSISRRNLQMVVPVYEEMAGVQPTREKDIPSHIDLLKVEEGNSSGATFLHTPNLYVN
ncbi:hypothetical protein DNTS_034972 [Danionella cerebrum]|uniref:Immunoglobulin V-set domain-containing protein n=1 Tax=Danionella cerebrum TaxID=2873325 RepID=A0A553MT88_9TELE|nr:hypothetical protein DNTS_034972 [Danionella translucida]